MAKVLGPQLVLQSELASAKKDVKSVIDESFNYSARKWYESVVFSTAYLVIGWATAIFLIGVFLLFIRKVLWAGRVRKIMPLNQAQAYKAFFEKKYSNVKVSDIDNAVIPQGTLKRFRGVGVPSDAWITKIIPSPIFTIGSSDVIINSVTWKYRRDNKDTFVSKTYTQVKKTGKKFDDLEFDLSKRGKISFNKGKDMDNDAFNKGFWFKHTNPVKFRMLFTVATQEKYVKLLKSKIGSGFKMDKLKDTLVISHSKVGTAFEVNVKKITSDENLLKEQFIADLKDDISVVFRILMTITALNGIIEK